MAFTPEIQRLLEHTEATLRAIQHEIDLEHDFDLSAARDIAYPSRLALQQLDSTELGLRDSWTIFIFKNFSFLFGTLERIKNVQSMLFDILHMQNATNNIVKQKLFDLKHKIDPLITHCQELLRNLGPLRRFLNKFLSNS